MLQFLTFEQINGDDTGKGLRLRQQSVKWCEVVYEIRLLFVNVRNVCVVLSKNKGFICFHTHMVALHIVQANISGFN